MKSLEQKNKKGISLIVLVVTIVVIIILVATVLYNITDGKIFGVANESVFKNDLRVIEEEFEMFVQTKAAQSVGKFEIESLNAADNGLTYNTKTNEKEKDIYDVIPTAKKGYYSEFEIIKGELYYKGDVEQKLIWAKELGIGIIPYEIVDGVLISANSNLLLLDSTGTVRIPYNVTEIANGVFNNLEGLTRVIIPGSVKKIGDNAFSNNTSLQEVIIEDGVEIIGIYAFSECKNLQTVKIPDSVKTISGSAFYFCTNLKNITLPKYLTSLEQYTFTGCENLEYINIPDGVTIIKQSCFERCFNLKQINIPENLKTISNCSLALCSSLENILIDSQNENFVFENKKLYNKQKDILYFVSSSVAQSTELTIEDGIKKIVDGALSNYENVKTINLPLSLEEITYNSIFYELRNIEHVNISENNLKYASYEDTIYDLETSTLIVSVSQASNLTVRVGTKAMANNSLSRCRNLENITLNNELESIGQRVFENTKIKNIYIPASVTYIDPIAFYTMEMDSIQVDPSNPNYSSDDKFLYNKNKTEIKMYFKVESNVEIPNGVEKIGNFAFHNKNMIKNITIPGSVKEIGNSFNYCSGLTSITIPNSVESISSSCFNFCSNLAQINIDNTKDSIAGAPWKSPYGMRAVNWLR